MPKFLVPAALLATVMLPNTGFAQGAAAPPTPPPAAGAQQSQVPTADFVKNSAVSDLFETQSSQLAAGKSQNQKIKQFAQQMIQDHTASAEKLKAAAAGVTIPTALDQDHSLMLQQLQGASGSAFDQAYVDMQVVGHQSMVSMFERYAQSGDNAQLKTFAQQTAAVIGHHLQMAQDLRSALTPPDRVAGEAQGAQNQGQIIVQQAQATIRVDQPPPQVTVQPGQPNVTVRQGPPEILIRQAAPTVTVDIPQPEVIVRMPPPDVNVAQAQPQVEVNQPPPQVQILQPQQQAQVQVEKTQPQVTVTQDHAQANVQLQAAGQPAVRFERAEPRVIVNQPGGEPTVRVEQMNSPAGQANQSPAAPATAPNQQVAAAPGPGAANQWQTKQVAVVDLKGVDVTNTNGQKVGDVDRLVTSTADNRTYVILANGGFLGLGERKVALPLDSMWMQGKKLVVSDLTDDQIKRMPEWKADNAAYREVQTTQSTTIRIPR